MEKLRAFVKKDPGAKLSLAYMHGKSNSSTVILPQWAKKKKRINLSMLFMEIYRSLGNANVINIYLQHVSKWPSCPRFPFKIKFPHSFHWKKKSDTESALQCKNTQRRFFLVWGGSVTLVEDFFYPTIPSPLSKYLSLCMSVPR